MTPRLRPDTLRVAATVWTCLLAGFAVYGFYNPRTHTVYDIYARAGRAWLAGDDLYTDPGTAYFRYSPLFAVGMAPLGLLPEGLGNALWRVFNGLVFAWGLAAFVRRLAPREWDRRWVGAFFLLVLPLSLHSMYNAQANLLMVGSVLLGLAGAVDGRWNRAAGWMAVATLVKGYPLAVALLLSAFHPRRFTPRFVVALAVGLLLPFLTQRPEVVLAQYGSWAAHLRDSTSIMRERLRTLEYLFLVVGRPVTPEHFLRWQALAGLGVLALCAFHARLTNDPAQRLVMLLALFGVWAALFGPATEACTYVVLAPAAAWLCIEVFRRPAPRLERALVVVSLICMGPLPTDFFGSTIRHLANLYGSQPLGALLFGGCLVARTFRPVKVVLDHSTRSIIPDRTAA